MLEDERMHLMPMPELFDGYVKKTGTDVEHVPIGSTQPLLGAVRAGRADGEYTVVSRPGRGSSR